MKKRKRTKAEKSMLEYFQSRRYQVSAIHEVIAYFVNDFDAEALRKQIVKLIRSREIKIVGIEPGGYKNDPRGSHDYPFPFDSLPVTLTLYKS